MKSKKTMSRWALARRLQTLALKIAAGRAVRIGGKSVRMPDELVVDEELEMEDGEVELELELRWPSMPAQKKAARASPAPAGRRAS